MSQRGAGSVLAIGAMAVVTFVAVAVLTLPQIVTARATATAAADGRQRWRRPDDVSTGGRRSFTNRRGIDPGRSQRGEAGVLPRVCSSKTSNPARWK